MLCFLCGDEDGIWDGVSVVMIGKDSVCNRCSGDEIVEWSREVEEKMMEPL
jgi:hypothetical protein